MDTNGNLRALLLKDLCSRLPYGVIVDVNFYNKTKGLSCDLLKDFIIDEKSVRPYLRPMSSMTEEEEKEINKYGWNLHKDGKEAWIVAEDKDDPLDYGGFRSNYVHNDDVAQISDWLCEHHFDYRGLIEKGMALEAPEDMYNEKFK